MKYSNFNTSVYLLFILSLVDSLLKNPFFGEGATYISFALMMVLLFAGVMSKDGAKEISGYKSFLIVFAISLVCHNIFTSENFLFPFFAFFTSVIYIVTPALRINTKIVANFCIVVFLIGTLLSLPALKDALFNPSWDNHYQGIFKNSNTIGCFSLLAIVCAFFNKSKISYKIIIISLALATAWASGSRNTVLTIAMTVFFYILQKSRFKKYSFLIMLLILVASECYMLIIEPYMDLATATLSSGKDLSSSSGRSEQHLYAFENFNFSLFGVGHRYFCDVIEHNFTTPHIFYFETLYGCGITFLGCYLYFIFSIMKRLKSDILVAFLLAIHIYFFFEPGMAYYPSFLNVVFLFVILINCDMEDSDFITNRRHKSQVKMHNTTIENEQQQAINRIHQV